MCSAINECRNQSHLFSHDTRQKSNILIIVPTPASLMVDSFQYTRGLHFHSLGLRSKVQTVNVNGSRSTILHNQEADIGNFHTPDNDTWHPVVF